MKPPADYLTAAVTGSRISGTACPAPRSSPAGQLEGLPAASVRRHQHADLGGLLEDLANPLLSR